MLISCTITARLSPNFDFPISISSAQNCCNQLGIFFLLCQPHQVCLHRSIITTPTTMLESWKPMVEAQHSSKGSKQLEVMSTTEHSLLFQSYIEGSQTQLHWDYCPLLLVGLSTYHFKQLLTKHQRYFLDLYLQCTGSRYRNSKCSCWCPHLLRRHLPILVGYHGIRQWQYVRCNSISLLRCFQPLLRHDIFTWIWNSSSIHKCRDRGTECHVFTSVSNVPLGMVHLDCHIHRGSNAVILDTVFGPFCAGHCVVAAGLWIYAQYIKLENCRKRSWICSCCFEL